MSDGNDLQFYYFHFMPYTHYPDDHKKYEATWVNFPNSIYDPEIGHQLSSILRMLSQQSANLMGRGAAE